MKTWVALAGAAALTAALAACGGGAETTKPAAASTPTPGPAAFLAWAHHASYGSKDFGTATDDALLNVGNVVCQGFATQAYGSEVQALTEGAGSPSTAEAAAFIDHAVPNLCPEYASRLP